MLVQNLELSIGKKLINRVPGKMVLTESGKNFYKYALEILSLMDKALLTLKLILKTYLELLIVD